MADRKSADRSRGPQGARLPRVRSPTDGAQSIPIAARPSASDVKPEIRHHKIAQAAFLRAEARGFVPGHELEDWLGAEAEIDGALARREPAATQQ